MRKILVLISVFFLAAYFGAFEVMAQEAEVAESTGMFQILKEKFIEGDWKFMSLVLICLILGLAFCIERIITLNLATANTDKLLSRIDERLADGDLDGAKEVCKATPGISLFIAIAPMLGFMGTVIGMIQAFDTIEVVGDISPAVVAGGIKVALLTTVFGLIVAIILQIFYNYIVSKIDGIVNRMEDSSIALVDVMSRNNVFR